MQSTSTVLMVRPFRFAFNPDTSANNAFQNNDLPELQVQHQALEEFDGYVETLRANGVEVIVVQDRAAPPTPDSIFPNNWFTTHTDGTLVLYPMQGRNRRQERGKDVLPALAGFRTARTLDLSPGERGARYLEGTGSLVLDREARIAYACRSVRTHAALLDEFARNLDYRVVAFDAHDRRGVPIYHTNVMMSVGSRLAPVCLDSIGDPQQRAGVIEALEGSGKRVLPLTFDQLEAFAGNMLEVRTPSGQPLLVMSRSAWAALSDAQRGVVEEHARPVPVAIDTIERVGGGSARCMLAEIFLPRRQAHG